MHCVPPSLFLTYTYLLTLQQLMVKKIYIYKDKLLIMYSLSLFFVASVPLDGVHCFARSCPLQSVTDILRTKAHILIFSDVIWPSPHMASTRTCLPKQAVFTTCTICMHATMSCPQRYCHIELKLEYIVL